MSCILRHPKKDHIHYDLRPLQRLGRNYVVKGRSNLDYQLNFCDALNTLPDGADEACGSSGACMITKNVTDGSVTKAESLGKPVPPAFEDDDGGDRVKFTFSAPATSNSTRGCAAVVRLLCSGPEEAKPEPLILFQVGCRVFMLMVTPSACPIGVVPTKPPTTLDCGVDVGDHVFDLRPLRNAGKLNGSYAVQTKDYDYLLNVCGPVLGGCPPRNDSSGAEGGCQTERYANGRSFSTGVVSKELRHLPGDVLQLKYESGSPCKNAAFNRSTIIYFFCDSHVSTEDSRPVFIEEKDECDYHFHWRTSLACRRKLTCDVTIPAPTSFDPRQRETINLAASLALKQGNYEAIATKIHLLSPFLINVCRPVNAESNMNCPPGAGICMPDVMQESSQNLGELESVC